MLTLNKEDNEMASLPTIHEDHEELPMLSTADKSDEDANSNIIIGPPLLTSSPSMTGLRAEGNGDGHLIRSVHSLLSPIHSGKRSHTTIESLPFSSPTPVTLDSFLTNFDQSSSVNKPLRPYSMEQELLLSEKITVLEENEAKKLLTKVLIDNMGLRQELRSKEKRITAYKGQMLAILDWKVRQDCDNESNDGNTPAKVNTEMQAKPSSGAFASPANGGNDGSNSDLDMIPQKTIRSSQEITMVEEVYGVRRSLSLIQELASSIEVDESLKDRFKDGCYLMNQLLLGGISGWMSALFLKKFGKLALSAAGGGLILLVYTARKGYVNVNYESIYQELSKFCEHPEDVRFNNPNSDTSSDSDASDTSDTDFEGSFDKTRDNWPSDGVNTNRPADELHQMCSYDKIKHAKNWITSHSYTVGGFVLTFVYNLI